jgi:hypothetical protein
MAKHIHCGARLRLRARRSRGSRAAIGIAVLVVPLAAPIARAQISLPTLPLPLFTPTPQPVSTATAQATASTTPQATSTETPAAATTSTSTPNPNASPIAGGMVRVSDQSDSMGTAGQSIDGGGFIVENTSGAAETITAVDIAMSDPVVVSSLTLTGTSGGGSAQATFANPSQDNTFVLDPALEITAGQTATFTLTGVIAGESVGTATAIPVATSTPTGETPTPSPTPTELFASVHGGDPHVVLASVRIGGRRSDATAGWLVALLTPALAATITQARRRRIALATVIYLALAASWLLSIAGTPGYGGEQRTTQTLESVSAATNDGGAVTFSGPPLSLGSVSRPQPLVFAGSSSVATITPTPIP